MIKRGPIALRAAEDALKNIGVTEEGENRGKWVEVYQKAVGIPPGSPWCAAFVRYRLEAAAKALGLPIPEDFPDSGWCPYYKDWAKQNNRWLMAGTREDRDCVQKGDLACFYFPAKNRIAHIGIVIETHYTGVYTVEGNTGPEHGAEVRRDGDGVYKKNRSWHEFGMFGGFVSLPF